MTEIDGDDNLVMPISIWLAFKANEVAWMIMGFGHVEFVKYCLRDMEDSELVCYSLVEQDHFRQILKNRPRGKQQ